MAYILKKTDNTFLVEIQNNSVDSTTTSLYLFGENTKNYGQFIDQNFVNLVQNFSNDFAPSIPLQGQLWYDRQNESLRIFNGVLWDTLSPTFDENTGTVIDLVATDTVYSEVLYVISNSKIISAYSDIKIDNESLSSNLTVNGKNYQLKDNFSNGLIAGITFANISNVNIGLNSSALSTDKLTSTSNIVINGSLTGNVLFDGSSNVNVSVHISNLYVGNTNVTVSGQHSNVTIDSTGRIVDVGNVTYTDIVSALEYVPYNSSNVSYDNVPNSLLFRNQFGDVVVNEMKGTVQYAEKLFNGPTIELTGEVEAKSNAIIGNSNVVISSVRSISSVTPGVYSSVTVNNKGVITAGEFLEKIPIGTVALYTNSVIPEGWARCDGSVVTTPTGQQVVTPNLSNVIVGGASYIVKVYSDKFLPSNDTIVGTLSVGLVGGTVPFVTFVGGPFINYPPLRFSNVNVGTSISTVTVPYKVQSVELTNKGKGYNVGEKIFIGSGKPTVDKNAVDAELVVRSVDTNGSILDFDLVNKGSYKNIIRMKDVELRDPTKTSGEFARADLKLEKELPLEIIKSSTVLVDIDFGEDLFFDATSLAIANGDPDAVFLSQLNIYGELKNLTISQILGNLKTRIDSQLPGRIGKFMLSYDDILQYSRLLSFDVNNTFFTTSVQNRLMYAKVADYANRFARNGFYPTDDKLFGAVLIGYERYVAILSAPREEIVINSLTNAGYEPLQFTDNDFLSNAEILTFFSKIITNAKVAVSNNRVARDVATTTNNADRKQSVNVPNALVKTSTFPTDNVKIILSEVIIDGLPAIIGNNVSNVQGGGSFVNASGDLNNVIYNLFNQKRNSTVTADDPWHPNDGPIGGTSGGFVGGGGGSGQSDSSSTNRPSNSTSTTPTPSSGTGSSSVGGIVGNPSPATNVRPTVPDAPAPPSTTPTGINGVMVSANMAVPNSTGIPNKEVINLVSASVPSGYIAQVTPAGGKHSRQGTQNHPGGHAADVVLIDKRTGLPAPTSVYKQYIEKAASFVGKEGGIEAALAANGDIRFIHVNTPSGSGRTFMVNHPDLAGTNFQNGNIERLRGTRYQYIYDQAVAAGLYAAYNNGIKKASGTVPPPAPPVPPVPPTIPLPKPTTSAVTSGGTLPNAVAPVSTVVAATSAVVATTQTVLKQTVDAATVVINRLIQEGNPVAFTLLDYTRVVSSSSGFTPPVVKPPTSVGGTVVNAVRPTLPTSSASGTGSSSGGSGGGSSSSGGGFSLGGTAGVSTGRTVTAPAPPVSSTRSGTSLSFGSVTGGQSASSGVMSSGASLSFGSSVSSAKPPSGSTATYSLGTTVSKPSSGGTGSTPVNTGGAFGLKGCFVFDTLVDMLDGTVKKIGELRLGDQIRGGEVLAIHCYDGAPLYNYRGVHVSGTHYVFENGEPIMVKDSVHAEKIDDVYGLYTVDTSGRRIFANDIEFADHNGDAVIFDFFKNSNTTTFNSEKEIFDEVLRQVKDAKL